MTRRGLVIGAGGVLGFAWATGALAALERAEGFDCRSVDALVGTSAGSILASLLACGMPVESIVRHHQGAAAHGDPVVDYDEDIDGAGPRPPLPAFALGSPGLLWQAARRPLSMSPIVALSGLVPRGRAAHTGVRRLIGSVLPCDEWPERPQPWVVAMDYQTGQRVVFGRDGAPNASLADAVSASCAVPGWFAPIEIGGRRYVDGGTCSTASVDLLAGCDLDEVYVLTPMASFAYDAPTTFAGRLERRVRRVLTRQLLREAEQLRASGTRVTLLGPGPEDLSVLGSNLMDGRRRSTVLETSLRTSWAALRPESAPRRLRAVPYDIAG
ncbi:patatin-like phospholipase family protein [Cryptosporangium aurantiacum]|uniref:NTE family protein n=1 Tax=Cryptosporangium aurantiacum TaxID=134849 RepID=A0A1M7RNX7_9ACTN|nr:patatin-like phospholipase family protein [Cryptosporangium aurantiacum]SHN47806.1 NTE family protein [Cryptosporangium aurantiacum]